MKRGGEHPSTILWAQVDSYLHAFSSGDGSEQRAWFPKNGGQIITNRCSKCNDVTANACMMSICESSELVAQRLGLQSIQYLRMLELVLMSHRYKMPGWTGSRQQSASVYPMAISIANVISGLVGEKVEVVQGMWRSPR